MRAGTSHIAIFPSSCAPAHERFGFLSVNRHNRHLDNDAAAPSFPRSPRLLPAKPVPSKVGALDFKGRSLRLLNFHINITKKICVFQFFFVTLRIKNKKYRK